MEVNEWNSQENRTPMSKTLSGKRVIGEASLFDQWREIQFIGSVAPAAVVVGLDPAGAVQVWVCFYAFWIPPYVRSG